MNYIISYPRSGNTAFRYIVEFLSAMPTDGLCGVPNNKDRLQKPLLHDGSDFVAHKRHDFRKVKPDDFVFFIIRHPLEAVIRHNEGKRSIDYTSLVGYVDDWFDMLYRFDEFEGNKMPVYYHKLIEVASKKSKEIYKKTQSKSLRSHRDKVGLEIEEKIDQYIRSTYPTLYLKYVDLIP